MTLAFPAVYVCLAEATAGQGGVGHHPLASPEIDIGGLIHAEARCPAVAIMLSNMRLMAEPEQDPQREVCAQSTRSLGPPEPTATLGFKWTA
jgi:hypothetical protein